MSKPIGVLLLGLASLVVSACGNPGTPASYDPIELALLRVEPTDGESSVGRNSVVRIVFNTTVLPESVNDLSLRVRIGGTFAIRPEGAFVISGNVVEFDPTTTAAGAAHAVGFPAGTQVLVEVPLFDPGSPRPANQFLQNIEGNPITVASGDSIVSFTTGCTWNDPVPGPPGVLGLEFTPGPNAAGQVDASAAVTVIFSEPIDPETFIIGSNFFLTNNTATAPEFNQPIPANVFYDGSLTRYTLVPVFGYGQGPFNIKVNFINPNAPDTFDPNALPRDLGGTAVQNFTFLQTFDTQFSPTAVPINVIREDFNDIAFMDGGNTDAIWGTDTETPLALVSAPITTRIQDVNVNAILNAGGVTAMPDTGGGPVNEGRYCAPADLLLGPDYVTLVNPPKNVPPSSAGRRVQSLYRQAELGAKGTIIRAAWAPLNDATTASSYQRVVINLGHKTPNTNLTTTGFAQEFDVDGMVTVADSSYSVSQSADVNGGLPDDGFVNWPSFDTFFDYDGQQDLLIDIQAVEGTATQFFRVFHAVSPVSGGAGCSCGLLFQTTGNCEFNNSIGFRSKIGVYGADYIDPTTPAFNVPNPSATAYLMEFELAKLESTGTSKWYDTGVSNPDYLDPIIGPLVQPCGAQIMVRWSGSSDGIVEDVPFTPNVDAVDGFRYIRFQITLRANYFTGGRARVQLVEIPFIDRS